MHMAFRPSATLQKIPDGVEGTRATLAIMRRLVAQFRSNINIRNLALRITDPVGVPNQKNFTAEVRAIQEWVRDNIRYVKDVHGVETVQTPLVTLEYRAGDCDDHSVLLASLLESIGHPTRFVAIKTQSFGPFVHVYTETKIGRRWVAVETTENWPLGTQPPIVAQRMVRY